MTTPARSVCARCGAPVRRLVAGSICPRCVLATALSGAPFDPRSTPEIAPGGPSKVRAGRYEVLEEIAHGGMGVVYRARDQTLNRVVALKLMLAGQFAGERELKRFRAEAEAAARLDHPNIVPIYEFGALEGRPFLSMRFVNGASLANRLQGTPMDAVPATKLMSTLARAIHYAHQHSVLH